MAGLTREEYDRRMQEVRDRVNAPKVPKGPTPIAPSVAAGIGKFASTYGRALKDTAKFAAAPITPPVAANIGKFGATYSQALKDTAKLTTAPGNYLWNQAKRFGEDVVGGATEPNYVPPQREPVPFVPAGVGREPAEPVTAERMMTEEETRGGFGIDRPNVPTKPASPGGNAFTGPAREFSRTLTDEGVRYEAPGGNFLEGRGTGGGGSFSVMPGRASDTPGYEQMSNEDKIAANVQAYRDDAAAYRRLNELRAGITEQQPGTQPAQQSGRAYDTWYEVESAQQDAQNNAESAARSAARQVKGNAAKARVFEQVYTQTLNAQNSALASRYGLDNVQRPTTRDELGIARFGLDAARYQSDQARQDRDFAFQQQRATREDRQADLAESGARRQEINDYVKRAGERQDVGPVENQMIMAAAVRMAQRYGTATEQVDNRIRSLIAQQMAAGGKRAQAPTTGQIQEFIDIVEAQLAGNNQ